MNEVFVIYGDVAPFPGMTDNACNREILAVTDSEEKASALVKKFYSKSFGYDYVNYEVMDME